MAYVGVGNTVDLDFSSNAIQAELNRLRSSDPDSLPLTPQAAGAIPPHTPASYIITAGSAQALTLAAPTAGTDDGLRISLRSSTAFAHTLTATGLFQAGVAGVNLATFAAFAGAGLTLIAFNGKWVVDSATGITFS